MALSNLNGIEGLRIGQVTDRQHHTGCTVVLAEKGAVAGVDVRGGAPGTHGTDALRPENLVDHLHGVVLTGGSAFGLAAVQGVMQYLREHNCGFTTDYGVVPIVSGAVVFDLGLNKSGNLPDAHMGYQACEKASTDGVEQGCVGAGTGATVGKLHGLERAMKGGQGFASLVSPGGLKVWALAVVNAYGDVLNHESGELLAGVRTLRTDGTWRAQPPAFSSWRFYRDFPERILSLGWWLPTVDSQKLSSLGWLRWPRMELPAPLFRLIPCMTVTPFSP